MLLLLVLGRGASEGVDQLDYSQRGLEMRLSEQTRVSGGPRVGVGSM